jgi:hypothetical protein
VAGFEDIDGDHSGGIEGKWSGMSFLAFRLVVYVRYLLPCAKYPITGQLSCKIILHSQQYRAVQSLVRW